MKKLKSILRSNFMILVIIFFLPITFLGLQGGKKQNKSVLRISSASDSTIAKLDGDELYKQNCSRCHQPPKKFPKSKTITIMKHMRVIANFTADEEEAMLKYLTK